MPELTLALARADLRQALGGVGQGFTPNDEQLDEALRGGLDLVVRRAPLCEAQLVLTDDQRALDVGARLADVFELISIYAHEFEAAGDGHSVHYRVVGDAKVELIGPTEPAAGMTLQVRYRRNYTVRNLAGALMTTLPTAYERILINAAAGEFFEMRAGSEVVVAGVEGSKFAAEMSRLARNFRTRALAALNDRAHFAVVPWLTEV